MRSASGRRLLGAAALLVALVGCGGGGDGGDDSTVGSGDRHAHDHADTSAPQFDAADATTTVAVELRDFSFVGLPAAAKGPNVLFEASVATGEHELLVQDATGEVVAGTKLIAPDGGAEQLAAVLQPGTYSIVCLVSEGAKTHDQLGMRASLVVE